VVGINSDASVARLKGTKRPLLAKDQRVKILAALEVVDHVALFDQDTPLELIRAVRPHVLVKGGDYHLHEIVGRDDVEASGGTVLTIPFEAGYSSTDIIQKIVKAHTA